mgnify:CR=1 FL=1
MTPMIVEHPLLQHKLSILRNKQTGTKEFRDLVGEIATLLCYEATRDLPLEEVEIETPITMAKTKVLAGRKLALVPILRAGMGMLDGMLTLLPAAKVGFIGLYRDEETLQPVEYFCKLPQDIAERDDLTQPEKLVMSSERFVKHFEDRGFTNIVLSAKAHSVQTTLDTYRALSREIPHVPLHLGVTEAGTKLQGTIKSSVGLGILLSEGIGDTMRVSLTADPVEEPPVAWGILQSLGLRRRGPEIVSCPTCARCQVNLIPIAEEVTERLKNYSAPLSIAVMGCAVNGPGEASDADLGVACGRGRGLLFSHGQIIGKVAEDQIVDALMAEVDKLIEEK